jgi:catechol 2,3-dioxygenase-like lactoylglutathione lyase family enzyme
MRRVAEIALFTDDPDRLISFYETLLEGEPAERWPGGAIFDLGGVTLLIHATGAGGPTDRDHFALEAPDVDEAAERLRAAGIEIDGPNDYDWGRSAYLTDSDGRMVELHRPK